MKVKLEIFDTRIKDDVMKLYESGQVFEIEVDPTYNEIQRKAIEIINLTLKNPIFVKNNSLITKQYRLNDYFFEVYNYVHNLINQHREDSEKFKLVLESETINKLYVRAYFTRSDLRMMSHFRTEYDAEELFMMGPDFNYDIRIVRRAAIDLLFRVLYLQSTINGNIDLSNIYLWDYKFGMR